MNKDNEKIYKSLASSYAEKEGAALKAQLESLNLSGFKYPASLDTRIKHAIIREKRKSLLIKFAPVAACLIITVIIFTGQKYFFKAPSLTAPLADKSPSLEYTTEFVTARLPVGYWVTGLDYDNGKAIYHIENEIKNEVIMVVEASDSPAANQGLRTIEIDGTTAYGISKADYSLLTYEMDSTTYTLTSKYNYLDLIEISEKIISTKL